MSSRHQIWMELESTDAACIADIRCNVFNRPYMQRSLTAIRHIIIIYRDCTYMNFYFFLFPLLFSNHSFLWYIIILFLRYHYAIYRLLYYYNHIFVYVSYYIEGLCRPGAERFSHKGLHARIRADGKWWVWFFLHATPVDERRYPLRP